ncbi:MAG: 5'/3'-nucleotidase SurE [Bacteroidales bacterium]|nr:5'/3'-nucleotidase SurE [Bacteroidales bacterium]
MRPLILIVNDDGYLAKGINLLTNVVEEMGDVVVVAPEVNASGKSHSLTTNVPLQVKTIQETPHRSIYAASGTPVDCVKLGSEHFCPRPPSLVLSGINHGSNSACNVLYSGTMGAVLEAATNGYQSVGFSLLEHHRDADFTYALPYVQRIVEEVLQNGLPKGICLNVNFPPSEIGPIRGMRVCRASQSRWTDSCEKRTDPYGHAYFWLTGHFECTDEEEGTDQWALMHGYASVVPCRPDFTSFSAIAPLRYRFEMGN